MANPIALRGAVADPAPLNASFGARFFVLAWIVLCGRGLRLHNPFQRRVKVRFFLAAPGLACGLDEAALLLLGRQLLGAELGQLGLDAVCRH